jgi:hypothetical protein
MPLNIGEQVVFVRERTRHIGIALDEVDTSFVLAVDWRSAPVGAVAVEVDERLNEHSRVAYSVCFVSVPQNHL